MDWNLFITTFSLIFLAELPDKTSLTTFMMATRGNPWAIFSGVALAFVIQSVVAVSFGSVFLFFPQSWVHLASGVLFLLFALTAWRRSNVIEEEVKIKNAISTQEGFWKSMSSSFWIIFIAEWGDLTQLASASLVARYGKALTICLSSILSLWTVSALAVFIGYRAKTLIHPKYLNKIAATVFFAVGLYLIFNWIQGI